MALIRLTSQDQSALYVADHAIAYVQAGIFLDDSLQARVTCIDGKHFDVRETPDQIASLADMLAGSDS